MGKKQELSGLSILLKATHNYAWACKGCVYTLCLPVYPHGTGAHFFEGAQCEQGLEALKGAELANPATP